MAAGLLGQFERQILRWVDHAFDDPEIAGTVTWTLYKGRSTAPTSFSIVAACVKRVVGDAEIYEGVSGQQGIRKYLIREQDLPAGVTVDSLTRNDIITDGGSDFTVTEINKTLEFVIQATCQGNG